MGIVTADEAVVFMREDCHVCRAEGLGSRARVLLRAGGNNVVATLYQVTSDLLDQGEAGLSELAWHKLGIVKGARIAVSHPPPLQSFSDVRARIFGNRLHEAQYAGIIADVASGRYSVIETAAFLTAGSAFPMDEADLRHVILMCSAVNAIDLSALETLETLDQRLRDMGVTLDLSEVKGPVMDRLHKTDFLSHLNGAVFVSQFEAWCKLTKRCATRDLHRHAQGAS